MANLIEWIKEELEEETSKIVGVVIGGMGWSEDYGKEGVPNYDNIPMNKVLTWDEAKKWIDYEFNDGYGAPGCNRIYVWTANKIFLIGQYDGSTFPIVIPRHPKDCVPDMPGG